jgi:hypothetical protein
MYSLFIARSLLKKSTGMLLLCAALAGVFFPPLGWAENDNSSGMVDRPGLPGGNYQPFSKKSPFNIPIPANPQLDPNSAAIVSTLLDMTQNSLGILRAAAKPQNIDYTFPFYFSDPSDPLYTIDCHFNGPPPKWGHCPLQGMQIHIPAYARRENSDDGPFPWSSDHHLAIIDPTSGIEFDMWGASQPGGSGGTLLIGWGGLGPRSGLGVKTFGATQSQFALTIGMVRAADLKAGSIPHALQMAIPCATGTGVYPAAVPSDFECAPDTVAPPYYGMRMQLDMSDAEIEALNAPAYVKTVYLALAHYGAFVSDTGTVDSIGFETEGGLSYTQLGLPDPWAALAQQYGIKPEPPEPDPLAAYRFSLDVSGVDLKSRLRIIAPCVTAGTCG